jgi:GNAT superfamily N-acetyltransferase
LSDAALIRAAATNHRSWWACRARVTGGSAWSEQGVRCIHLPMDGELLFPFPRSIPPGALAAALAAARPRVAGCWHTGLYRPTSAARELARAGFTEGWQPHWMAGTTAPGRLDPRVERVGAVPEYDAHGQALLRMPRSLHYVARVDGRLAGYAWLHTSGAIAGIYDVEVWPEHGRRGLGTALMHAALADAHRLGHSQVVLNATGDGTALYETMGFRSLGWGLTWWRHDNCPPASATGE